MSLNDDSNTILEQFQALISKMDCISKRLNILPTLENQNKMLIKRINIIEHNIKQVLHNQNNNSKINEKPSIQDNSPNACNNDDEIQNEQDKKEIQNDPKPVLPRRKANPRTARMMKNTKENHPMKSDKKDELTQEEKKKEDQPIKTDKKDEITQEEKEKEDQPIKTDKKDELTQEKEKEKDEIQKKLNKLKQKIAERENDLGFQIGFTGEAYVFEDLQRLNCFEKIQWDAQTDEKLNPSVTLNNNHKYFIKGDNKSYDILATDKGGKNYFFEVKSTDSSTNNKSISSAQKKFCGNLSHNNRHYIKVKVRDVLSDHPTISYQLFDPKENRFTNINDDQHTEKYFLKSLYESKENHQKLPKLEPK